MPPCSSCNGNPRTQYTYFSNSHKSLWKDPCSIKKCSENLEKPIGNLLQKWNGLICVTNLPFLLLLENTRKPDFIF